ncbi:hypothetical protein [Pseudonocardia alni]|uniref:Uncharacterized protein n=1 Tax=Pseudonocardia alni TaxID=33907 RepID=A0AA44USC2_PSEA5|nr:hypothetical protein [Pseudonocardia alni]PKB32461.1 hypothetical protein ATL51_4192 [Pseudonocardia alni]
MHEVPGAVDGPGAQSGDDGGDAAVQIGVPPDAPPAEQDGYRRGVLTERLSPA